MGPPSSGGLTVGQILGMLEGFDLPAMGPTAEAHHLFIEAS
jgi:gamma-glutamyltranspeptidase/glutathione hydrolase